MSALLARLFRWSNSKLFVSQHPVTEKFLKIIFYLSVIVYRMVKPRAPMKSRPVVIHNFDSGLHLRIDRSRSMGAAIYWTGFHEFREFVFLHQYLRPDMVFVDVGANLGEYSLFAARRLKNGNVLAFEPLPSIRSVLTQNIALNGFKNIVVYPFGLSSIEGTMAIHEFADVHEGLATLFPGDRLSKMNVAVELKKLDDIIPGSGLNRIDFIKIDIEGGELSALQGSGSVIERYRPVFMIEINKETYQTAGYTVGEVHDFFNGFHYRPYCIRKHGRLESVKSLPSFGNIVFMPQ